MKVWLNGSFVDRDAAAISIFDAGLQHGVGLFETMLARNGRVFRIERHLQRLAASAATLRLTEDLRLEPLAEAVARTVRESGLDAARVRLTVTGGDLNLLQTRGESRITPTLIIVAQPPTAYPPAFFEQGVMVTITDGRLNPLGPTEGHKTLNYWARISALQVAAARRAGESLWFTVSNHLAGGSVSNVFLVRDGDLVTPTARGETEQGAALPAPVLPGITRDAILELAELMEITASHGTLTVDDLLAADEVFLTNSSWGVLPVTAVERETIGGGAVGPVTKRLRDAWLALVDQETEEDG